MSSKSCAGTAIDFRELVAEIGALHTAQTSARDATEPPFGAWYDEDSPSAQDRAVVNHLMLRAEEASRKGIEAGLPTVESIRTTRRIGPSGQIVFDLVAEITQSRIARRGDGGKLRIYGGATVIFDPGGKIRYVIAKGVNSSSREERHRRFAESEQGERYGREVPTGALSRSRTPFGSFTPAEDAPRA